MQRSPLKPSVSLAAQLVSATLQPTGKQRGVRGPLIEILTAAVNASEGDKQLGSKLAEQPGWGELVASLPLLQAEWAGPENDYVTWGCGPPPTRPSMPGGGGMGGEEAELMALLSKTGFNPFEKPKEVASG